MNDQIQQLLANAPPWAREPAVQIGVAVVVALVLLWLLSKLFRSRPQAEEIAEPVYHDDVPVTRPITPPTAPAPPPIVEAPIAPPAPAAEIIAPPVPVVEPVPDAIMAPEPVMEPEHKAEAIVAPEPVAEPEPVAVFMPEPEVVAAPAPEPEPTSPSIPEEAPQPVLADEPIAAAAPQDASPASIAADVPVAASAPVAAAGTDELTRMKGVGPRLADRLNSVGITSFAQIAALTPENADALDAQLGDFQGRMHRDRWIEQAGYLASGDIAGFEDKFGKL